jgi:hypothetical protein
MIVIGIRKISEKAAILNIPLDCSSTSDIKKRPNHQFLLLLPMVSNRVKEYDAECNMANNAMGSKATVTGSEPVYRNNKL